MVSVKLRSCQKERATNVLCALRRGRERESSFLILKSKTHYKVTHFIKKWPPLFLIHFLYTLVYNNGVNFLFFVRHIKLRFSLLISSRGRWDPHRWFLLLVLKAKAQSLYKMQMGAK